VLHRNERRNDDEQYRHRQSSSKEWSKPQTMSSSKATKNSEGAVDAAADATNGSQSSQSHILMTILSGFLGSGNTTLMNNTLESEDHKLRIVVIVNDMAELKIDASLPVQ